MLNALTIDVEDYWKIYAHDWLGIDTQPTEAVVTCTMNLLTILDEYQVKATFFVLGEVAKKYPHLAREIVKQGHEVGVHGYEHYVIYTISRRHFHREVEDAKKLIEDTIGMPADGHRAPSFSITPKTKWALDILAEVGYKYDSSIFPFAGRRYGWPGFSRNICNLELSEGKNIIEVPMSTVRVFGKNMPACGGGYLRHFPYLYTNWSMQRIQAQRPAIVYMHPYDTDTTPPPDHIAVDMLQAPRRSKLRHALQIRNRRTVVPKLKRLLSKYQFSPIRDVIDSTQFDNENTFQITNLI